MAGRLNAKVRGLAGRLNANVSGASVHTYDEDDQRSFQDIDKFATQVRLYPPY